MKTKMKIASSEILTLTQSTFKRCCSEQHSFMVTGWQCWWSGTPEHPTRQTPPGQHTEHFHLPPRNSQKTTRKMERHQT